MVSVGHFAIDLLLLAVFVSEKSKLISALYFQYIFWSSNIVTPAKTKMIYIDFNVHLYMLSTIPTLILSCL